MIDLNVKAVVHLAKLAAKQMVGRRSGRILITASIPGTTPTPQQAVYRATKAFDLEFAQSLYYELKYTGVTVTALKTGATRHRVFPPRRDGRHKGRHIGQGIQ